MTTIAKRRPRLEEMPSILMEMLKAGSRDRDEVYQLAKADKRLYQAMFRLKRRGLIRCKVELTEAGMRALGLKGPKT